MRIQTMGAGLVLVLALGSCAIGGHPPRPVNVAETEPNDTPQDSGTMEFPLAPHTFSGSVAPVSDLWDVWPHTFEQTGSLTFECEPENVRLVLFFTPNDHLCGNTMAIVTPTTWYFMVTAVDGLWEGDYQVKATFIPDP